MVSARPIDERLVLVVDDDPGIRESLTDLLHTKPIMDGRGFLQRRAHDPALRNIPVVVVSANLQSGAPLQEIDGYFRKPVNVDRLIEVIDQQC